MFSNEISAQPVEVIPDATIPQVPLNLTAETGSEHILLSWEPPFYDGGATITNYKLYKDTSSGSESDFINVGTELSYNDTKVSKGVSYYYKVRAVNVKGDGPLTDELEAVIKTVPEAPLNLSAVSGDLFVYLSWKAPASDGGSPVQKYNIYRREAPGGIFKLLKSRGMPYYNDSDVGSGVTYHYVVTAENSMGESIDSEQVSAKPLKVLSEPSAEVSVDVYEGKAPLTVKFSSSAMDTDGLISSYLWDFDDGTTSTEDSPEHTFIAPGTYNVTLTVEDNDGLLAVVLTTIIVEQQPVTPPDDTKPDGTDTDDKKYDEDKESGWKFAAQITVALGIIVILLVLGLSLVFTRKKIVVPRRGPPPKTITVKKRRRHIDEELPPGIEEYDEELFEE